MYKERFNRQWRSRDFFLLEKNPYQCLLNLLVCMKKRTVVLLSSSCRKIDSYKLQICEGSVHDTIFSSFR